VQNLVSRDYSKCAHTQVPAHISIQTIQNLIYTQLEMGSRLETTEGMHEDSRMEWKTWELIST